MTQVQGLGIELYFYVRCPTCNKVLGHLEQDYNKLIREAINDINETIPRLISLQERQNVYDEQMDIRFTQIMNILGVKRYCCMRSVRNPQQVPVGLTKPLAESTAVSRHTPGVERAPTIIKLTGPSRVPGGSNLNMMSLGGYEDTLNLLESENKSPMIEFTTMKGLIQKTTLSGSDKKKSLAPKITSLSGIPTIQTGETSVVRPKLRNIKIEVEMPDYMDIEGSSNPNYTDIPHMEKLPVIDDTTLLDLDKMSLSYY